MKTPKPGSHRKPGPAARHTPAGYEQMVNCPTCHGKGKVPKVEHSAIRQAARRAS